MQPLMILIALARSRHVGDAMFNALFHPIAERLLERCDAVLRVGGPSQGADEMKRLAQAQNKRVFFNLDEVPAYTGGSAQQWT